jgi:hypothetical protein
LSSQGQEGSLSPFHGCVGDGRHGEDTSDMGGDGEEIGIESVEPIITQIESEVLMIS